MIESGKYDISWADMFSLAGNLFEELLEGKSVEDLLEESFQKGLGPECLSPEDRFLHSLYYTALGRTIGESGEPNEEKAYRTTEELIELFFVEA